MHSSHTWQTLAHLADGQDVKQMLLDIYTTSISSDHLGENDRVSGCKLAESMLLNLREYIDDVRTPHTTYR